MIDEVPRFLTLPSESFISRNPSKTAPTTEEASAAFLSAAFALRDTIRELIVRTKGKI